MLLAVSKKVILNLINLYFEHSIYIECVESIVYTLCSKANAGWVEQKLMSISPWKQLFGWILHQFVSPQFYLLILRAALCHMNIQHYALWTHSHYSQETSVAKVISLAEVFGAGVPLLSLAAPCAPCSPGLSFPPSAAPGDIGMCVPAA